MEPKLRIVDLDDGSAAECTLAEFLETNAEDEETCDAVRGLCVDASVRVGGGAAPAFDITRTS